MLAVENICRGYGHFVGLDYIYMVLGEWGRVLCKMGRKGKEGRIGWKT